MIRDREENLNWPLSVLLFHFTAKKTSFRKKQPITIHWIVLTWTRKKKEVDKLALDKADRLGKNMERHRELYHK